MRSLDPGDTREKTEFRVMCTTAFVQGLAAYGNTPKKLQAPLSTSRSSSNSRLSGMRLPPFFHHTPLYEGLVTRLTPSLSLPPLRKSNLNPPPLHKSLPTHNLLLPILLPALLQQNALHPLLPVHLPINSNKHLYLFRLNPSNFAPRLLSLFHPVPPLSARIPSWPGGLPREVGFADEAGAGVPGVGVVTGENGEVAVECWGPADFGVGFAGGGGGGCSGAGGNVPDVGGGCWRHGFFFLFFPEEKSSGPHFSGT
ncbi:hypothetical protein DFH27DRAFT_173549 [Peziza echinospora]|nr:hypothetical protein DFH27DRAFT_173549 [Peziza echinospora]